MNKEYDCDFCHDTGFEICDNPDHGFIDGFLSGFSSSPGSSPGRMGCPLCGHDPLHRIFDSPCHECEVFEGIKRKANMFGMSIRAFVHDWSI